MKQISEEVIEKSLAFINNASDDILNLKSEEYADNYETLVAYVFQTAAEENDEDLLGYLVYYYTLIMNIFETAGYHIPEVSDSMIDAFHDEYLELIEEFQEDEDYSDLSTFIGQPTLMSFLIQDMEMEDEDGSKIDEELQSMLNMILIGFVGVLNRAVNP
jgi:hypothetical protein